MPFEIGFRPSTNTEGPIGFSAAVARAMARVGARHDREAETVTLSSGETVQLVLDEASGMALAIADGFSEELVALTWALADETASFIQAMDLTAATQTAGDPPAILLSSFPQVRRLSAPEELHDPLHAAFLHDEEADSELAEGQAAYDRALADSRAAGRPNLAAPPRPSFFKRLTDALFGKAI
ncbi:MAG TPA: hypothetical protein VEA44_14195 [Caulobacter sp.]|nr:hypothetical protein [Caulobacter sp.]